MLYNPKWEAPSIKGFKAWVRAQDPTTIYDYVTFDNCPCALYSYSLGLKKGEWVRDLAFQKVHTYISAMLLGYKLHATFGYLSERLK